MIETIFPHSSIAARQAQHLMVDLIFVGLLVDYKGKFIKTYDYYNRKVISKKKGDSRLATWQYNRDDEHPADRETAVTIPGDSTLRMTI
jgi:hypothetical protein